MPLKPSEHAKLHTPEAILSRLDVGAKKSYLRDFVYGAVDGAVTTFAVVAGAAGASLSSGIVLVLGFANLIADGFSMAASNFLGIRAESQLRDLARSEEYQEIKMYPEGEREETRQIFARKGFAGEELERIVGVITADDRRWVETMLTEEHGLALEGPSALRGALVTFGAFVSIGAIPLAAYLWNSIFGVKISDPFWWSAVLTGLAFFSVGAVKGRFVAERWYISGIETLALGGVAACLAYFTGAFLRGLAG